MNIVSSPQEFNMARCFVLFIISCILHLYPLCSSIPLVHARHLCPYHQSLSLLQFKDSLKINGDQNNCAFISGFFSYIDYSSQCDSLNNPITESKITSWKNNTDCCSWGGVTCDQFTGQVIALDLSASRLTGIIDSNSSIFRLSHLKRLNLAYNYFHGSDISPEFRRFTRLSHLNLSYSGFQGQIPSEISQLNQLVSLDLSEDFKRLSLEPHVFTFLLQNMTMLRELSLGNIDIPSSIPNNLSSSLTVIDLSYTVLRGTFPYHIFQLPNLQQLSLFGAFDGPVSLARVEWNASSYLQKLKLSVTFSEKFPDTIGNLKHLTYLDLPTCGFMGTIPRSLGNLTHLNFLNIGGNKFSGPIPTEILALEQLTFLDISYNLLEGQISNSASNLKRLRYLNLKGNMISGVAFSFLKNLTRLEGIDLSQNSVTGGIPFLPLKSLRYVDLSFNSLEGMIPPGLFQLSSLQFISLRNNKLHGPIPSLSNLVNLFCLYLSSNNLSGNIKPNALSNLVNLVRFDLSSNNFSGHIEPNALSNLVKLEELSLASNQFTGSIPISLSNLVKLFSLDLSSNHFSGIIEPIALSNLSNLFSLHLSSNQFTGRIEPTALSNLVNLRFLDLSSNNLSGHIEPNTLSKPVKLVEVKLASNHFTGPITKLFTNLVNLETLDLSSNNFGGYIEPSAFSNLVNLSFLDLSSNNFSGHIEPITLSNLVNLGSLELSSNNFSGDLDVKAFLNVEQLYILDLSFSGLSLINEDNTILQMQSISILLLASCKIREFNFLGSAPELLQLNLSYNHIQDEIPGSVLSNLTNIYSLDLSHNLITRISEIPLPTLKLLDLRFNLLEGAFPIMPSSINFLFISNNQLHGEIKPSICDLSTLRILDLSNNSFSGALPQCIGNMSIEVLDLHMNKFQGTIPTTFSVENQLKTLNLRGNKLKGEVPLSLINCIKLEVLDLSDNNLNGMFPLWLGSLPNLRVLSLRSNKLYGQISPTDGSSKDAFTQLQVLDLSHNQLNGKLPMRLFQFLRGMIRINQTSQQRYFGRSYYSDSINVVIKGNLVGLERILTIFATIDLSCNEFEGEVPDSIGGLFSIQLLNLSHNDITGGIPPQLGQLSQLQSLDLSFNHLDGNIPDQLAALGFLSVMNLSYNHLTGRIPDGSQLQTFQNDSYIGNEELCGYPLTKKCGGGDNNPSEMQPHPGVSSERDHQDFFDGFTWQSIVVGYGVGTFVGLVIGCLMVFNEKPKWLIQILQEEVHRVMCKYKSRKGLRPL